ncbi:MAG: hypothetical protein ACLPKB_06800 [Xanthobacteraceae bacterium]
MHKTILSGAMALAVVGAGALNANTAGAGTLAGQGLRPAIESLGSVDTVSCRRHGTVRHHCGYAERADVHAQVPQEYSAGPSRNGAPEPHRYFSRW